MHFRIGCLMVLILAGCASTPSPDGGDAAPERAGGDSAGSVTEAPRNASGARKPAGPSGIVAVDITDVSGRHLPSRVMFQDADGQTEGPFEVATGSGDIQPRVGAYKAYVYVYDQKVPVLASVQEVVVAEDKPARLEVNLLEGGGGKLSIRDFDLDHDLAVDRVELEAGTDPLNAGSIPGHKPLQYDMRVLGNENAPRWFKGELHAVSTYGGGKEGVAALVQRAEQAGLDFLAIADLNTMEACSDPAFRSDRVVLIPALSWGSKDGGIALIYGPGTMPGPAESVAMAQAECIRVQNQGGVFVIAHPCFTGAPWKWGVDYVNAVQVWNGPWRTPAPLRFESLPEDLRARVPGTGNLVYSIAAAAAVADKTAKVAANAGQKDRKISANDQAALFWDYELVRGAVCSVVGGGMVDNPKAPMAQPTTWIYAANKSLPAIMEGLRLGRTFVGNRPDGVQLNFRADVLNDGKVDVGMGGAIPLRVDVGFYILVTGANGGKVELLRNGHAIMSEIITSDVYSKNFMQTTDFRASYRLRVIRQPENPDAGYGPVEVLALSSPIYADDIGTELLMTGPVDRDKTWVELKEDVYKGPPIDPNVMGQ